jgi:hypothetical protein
MLGSAARNYDWWEEITLILVKQIRPSVRLRQRAWRCSPRSAAPHYARATALKAEQQLRQLRHVDRNPPRLVLREQLGGRAPAGLLLEINVSELLAAMVNHDKAGGLLFDRPGRREAADLSVAIRLRL